MEGKLIIDYRDNRVKTFTKEIALIDDSLYDLVELKDQRATKKNRVVLKNDETGKVLDVLSDEFNGFIYVTGPKTVHDGGYLVVQKLITPILIRRP